MLRRRQASQPGPPGGPRLHNSSIWNDDDGGRTSTNKRRSASQFIRANLTRVAALTTALSIMFVVTTFLPLPLRTGRVVRNATVRLLASTTNTRRSPSSSSIIFPSPMATTESIISAEYFLAKKDFLHGIGRPQINGLVIQPLAEHDISRAIDAQDRFRHEEEREALLEAIDEPKERERALHYEDYAPEHRQCQRNNWRDRKFPNCLTFHETSVLDRPLPGPMKHGFDIQYTGHGYFRDSWMYQSAEEQFVLKKMRHIDAFDYDDDYMYQIHREAIVMERLTASPSIVNIYGHCATSIMSEPMLHEVTNDIVINSRDDNYAGYMKQSELDKLQIDDVRPMNNLTNEQKLDIAIAMAESIAEIHGYEGGVIIHGDIHPYQWLANEKGQIKLNDFNNGEILEFDVEKQEYCKIYRCFGGTYRSPEEFRCIDSHEGMDTYSMGNNLYILLTGLWPFYQYDPDDSEFVQDLLIENKEKPFIDPRYRNRSIIEAGLVKAMEKAWEWDLDKRESIFEMLRQLYALRDSVTKKPSH